MIRLKKMSAMQAGRVNKCLDTTYRFDDGTRTLRQQIERAGVVEKRETDGMIDFNRRAWNRMDGDDQRQYEARLRDKRYYWVNNVKVQKVVYDALD